MASTDDPTTSSQPPALPPGPDLVGEVRQSALLLGLVILVLGLVTGVASVATLLR